jgi:hypothetical protein
MNIIDAIKSLRPGSQWRITETDYSSLVWADEIQTKPTKAELEAEVIRLQAEYEAKDYARQRAPEYPSLADLADAMYWASKGDNTKLDNYYAACEAVKLKYPKS